MVINHLLNGMILQVGICYFRPFFWGDEEIDRKFLQPLN